MTGRIRHDSVECAINLTKKLRERPMNTQCSTPGWKRCSMIDLNSQRDGDSGRLPSQLTPPVCNLPMGFTASKNEVRSVVIVQMVRSCSPEVISAGSNHFILSLARFGWMCAPLGLPTHDFQLSSAEPNDVHVDRRLPELMKLPESSTSTSSVSVHHYKLSEG